MRYLDLVQENLSETSLFASKALKEGGIIIYPTTTLYGFGALLSNVDGLKRINIIKKRAPETPQILLIDYQWIPKYIQDYERYMPLLEVLWPGPFTLLLPHTIESPFVPDDLIAFRVSDHAFITTLLENTQEPISSTSVNETGEKPLIRRNDIIDRFSDVADLIIYEQEHNYARHWDEEMMKNCSLPSTMINAVDFPEKIDIIRFGVSDLSKVNTLVPDLEVVRSYEK